MWRGPHSGPRGGHAKGAREGEERPAAPAFATSRYIRARRDVLLVVHCLGPLRTALVAISTLVACSVEQRAPAGDAKAAAPADGPRYELEVKAPARAVAGQPVEARVTVQAHAPWHINLDYAARLEIDANARVEAGTAATIETARFDAEGLALVYHFEPSGRGPLAVAGELRFAVCGEEACAPEHVPVDFTVEVACDTGTLC